MTCCETPTVRQDDTHSTASCLSCGFRWEFTYQGKGRFKSKDRKWGPAWFCKDDYDRSWRMKNYDRHEVIGTRRRGTREDWVIACPRHSTVFSTSTGEQPDEVYCPHCDRAGLFGPMLTRYRQRKEDDEDV